MAAEPPELFDDAELFDPLEEVDALPDDELESDVASPAEESDPELLEDAWFC